MRNDADALVVDAINFKFESKRRTVEVLRDISFRVPAGQCAALVGRSGVGKSTLINLIAGFLAPTAGQIRAFGSVVNGPSRGRQAVFQESALWPWLSVLDNVLLGLDREVQEAAAQLTMVHRLLGRVGLADAARAYPGQLSGGMQKRVELVRAIVARPRILMLDEALRSVDPISKRICADLIDEFREEHGAAIVMVSHDLDEVTRLASSAVILKGTPAGVMDIVDLARFGRRPSQRKELSRLLGYAI